jgi:hypothetical protein
MESDARLYIRACCHEDGSSRRDPADQRVAVRLLLPFPQPDLVDETTRCLSVGCQRISLGQRCSCMASDIHTCRQPSVRTNNGRCAGRAR